MAAKIKSHKNKKTAVKSPKENKQKKNLERGHNKSQQPADDKSMTLSTIKSRLAELETRVAKLKVMVNKRLASINSEGNKYKEVCNISFLLDLSQFHIIYVFG